MNIFLSVPHVEDARVKCIHMIQAVAINLDHRGDYQLLEWDIWIMRDPYEYYIECWTQ